jgi:4-amino-4-deoxy-L-arabinose transferase-like glycosyltransferase
MCLDKRIALCATGIVAFLPSHILYAGLLASENLFTPLLLSSAILFLLALEPHKKKWPMLTLCGLLLGLATLVRSIALFLPATWMLFLFWKHLSPKQVALMTSVVGVMTVATIMPWIMRNYSVSGKFVIQTNAGSVLLLGAHEKANGHYVPEIGAELRKDAKEMGLDEFETNALAYRRAIQFIRTHPIRWIALIPLRWWHLFKHDASGVVWNFRVTKRPYPRMLWYVLAFVAQGYYSILMVMAITGFSFITRTHMHRRGYGFPLAFVFHWLAFHAICVGVDRFHIPLLPFLAMFSALGLLKLVESRSRKK